MKCIYCLFNFKSKKRTRQEKYCRVLNFHSFIHSFINLLEDEFLKKVWVFQKNLKHSTKFLLKLIICMMTAQVTSLVTEAWVGNHWLSLHFLYSNFFFAGWNKRNLKLKRVKPNFPVSDFYWACVLLYYTTSLVKRISTGVIKCLL